MSAVNETLIRDVVAEMVASGDSNYANDCEVGTESRQSQSSLWLRIFQLWSIVARGHACLAKREVVYSRLAVTVNPQGCSAVRFQSGLFGSRIFQIKFFIRESFFASLQTVNKGGWQNATPLWNRDKQGYVPTVHTQAVLKEQNVNSRGCQPAAIHVWLFRVQCV